MKFYADWTYVHKSVIIREEFIQYHDILWVHSVYPVFFVKIVYCIDNITFEVYLLLFTVVHEIIQTLMEIFYECIMYYTKHFLILFPL